MAETAAAAAAAAAAHEDDGDDVAGCGRRSFHRTHRAHIVYTVSGDDFDKRYRISTKPVRSARSTEVTAAVTKLAPGCHADLHPFLDAHAVVMPSWMITALSDAAQDDGPAFVARVTAEDIKTVLHLATEIAKTPMFHEDAAKANLLAHDLIIDWVTRLLVQTMASQFMTTRVLELKYGNMPMGAAAKIARLGHATERRWLFTGPPKIPPKTGTAYWSLRLAFPANPSLQHKKYFNGTVLTAAVTTSIARVARDDVTTPMWAAVDAVRRMPPETQARMIAVPGDPQYASVGSMIDGTLLMVLPQINSMLHSLFTCTRFPEAWRLLQHTHPDSKGRAGFVVRDLSLIDAYSMRSIDSHYTDMVSQSASSLSQSAARAPTLKGKRHALHGGPQIIGGGHGAHCRRGGTEITSMVTLTRRVQMRAGQRARNVLQEPCDIPSAMHPGDDGHVYTADPAYAAGVFECASSFAYVREYVRRLFSVVNIPPDVATVGDGRDSWSVAVPVYLEAAMVEAAAATKRWYDFEPWERDGDGDDDDDGDDSDNSDADMFDHTPTKRRRLPSRKEHAEAARRVAALGEERRSAVPAHVNNT